MSLLKTESYRKGIAISSILNVFAKLLLFAQNVVIAFYFGTNQQVDVFFFCYSVIVLVAVTLDMLNGGVIIPESMRIREKEGEIAAQKFLNIFLYFYLVAGIILTSVILINPVKVLLFISDFDFVLLSDNVQVIAFSIPLLTLIMVNDYLVSVLTAYKYFTAPQWRKLINSSIALLFLFIFHNVLSVTSVFVGLILGYSINIFLVFLLMVKRLNWNFRPKRYKIERRIIRNGLLIQAGTFLKAFAQYFGMFLLSGLSAGVVAALNYGQRTARMVSDMITLQFSPVAGIKLNELFARERYAEINKIFHKSTSFLTYILLPLSGIIFLYSHEIITVLYQHGEFDSSSVNLSSAFFTLFALDLSLQSINNMVSRIFMAGYKVKQYFYYHVFKNGLLVLFIYLGVKEFGGIGFPIALLVSDALNLFVMLFMVRLVFPFVNYWRSLLVYFRDILLNVAFVGVAFLSTYFLPEDIVLVRIMVGSMVYGLLFIAATLTFRLNEDMAGLIMKGLNMIGKIRKKIVK